MARRIEIDQNITVSHLAQQLELPATNIISQLLKNGLVLTLNEKIDFDTVSILIDDLGLDVEVQQKQLVAKSKYQRRNVVNASRPPVVALMGHIDHGKTSLLDKIRNSNRVEREAGGITQHISATQVEHQNRFITFLDTPGHEAFAAVREHGAFLTDLAILVVAADEGVKDQTIEALRFAKKSGVKVIVAATKIDKENANLHLLKQQLAENGLMAEDLGGETIVVPVSSKDGRGITELLDMILLVADIEDFQADSRGRATGLIIETYMQQGLGPVAVVLVQEGVLKPGDFLVAGETSGKVRLLKDMNGKILKKATASTPVLVSGFKVLPQFGLNFEVVKTDKEAKNLASAFAQQTGSRTSGISSSEFLRILGQRASVSQHKVIIKTDVRGSLTAVMDGLKALDTDEVVVTIVDAGVGGITENDISKAQMSEATIYGFNLDVPAATQRQISYAGVDLKVYSVIYELLEDAKAHLESLLAPEIKRTKLGSLKLKAIFKTTKTELICGGELVQGKLSLPAFVSVSRGGETLVEDIEVASLAKGASQVKELVAPTLCGIGLKTTKKIILKEGDKLEFYRLDVEQRKL